MKVIDLSADHRFPDPAVYADIYGAHAHPESLTKAVYGCPELNRASIKNAELTDVLDNPTSVILAASPIVRS